VSNRPRNRPTGGRPTGSRLRQRPVLAFVVVLVVIGVVSGSVALAVTSSSSDSTATSSPNPSSSISDQAKQALLARATEVSNLNAENLDDVSATKPAATSGQAVITTQGVVNEVFGGTSAGISDDTGVYLMQLRGNFKQRQALPSGAPKSAANETGTVLLMVVSQDYQVLGEGIGSQPVDLSKIGPVITVF
jgi:hypothetical protein